MFCTLFLLFLFFVVCYWILPLVLTQRKAKTKGPGPLWIINKDGTNLAEDIHEYLKRNKLDQDISHIWLGPQFTILINDAEAAEFVIKNPDIIKAQTKSLPSFDKHFGDGILVFLNGADWRRVHKIMSPGFTRAAIGKYYDAMMSKTNKTIEIFKQKGESNFEIDQWMHKYSLDVLGVALYSKDLNRLDGKTTEIYDAYHNTVMFTIKPLVNIFMYIVDYLPISQVKEYHKSLNIVVNYFTNIIKEHKQSSKGDFVDTIISSLDQEDGMNESELLGNLFGFFFAGHESTASSLSFAIRSLIEHPDIQQRLYEEINSKIGDRSPTIEDINELQYLDRFIKENLRLYPTSTGFPSRVATKDVKYKDFVIPKGSYIAINHFTIQRSPVHWKEPDQFDPDRFLPENSKGRHRFAYLPFNLGPRECIGKSFSIVEQALFLTRLLQEFEIVKGKGTKQSKEFSLLYQPTSVFVQLKPRKSKQ